MSGEPWLILPTYNESENLEAIVSAASAVLTRATEPSGQGSSDPSGESAGEPSAEGSSEPRFRILVVDDGSPDGTGEIADRLASEHSWLRVLHRAGKGGLGPAYIAGFRYALDNGAGYLMEMDSDFSHDPTDLARLLAAADPGAPDGGASLVLGSRYVAGGGVADWSPLRRFVSEGGSTYARIVLSLPVKDLTGGFKCFRREVLEAIDFESVRSRGYAFQVELTYRAVRAGFKVVEIPIIFRDREVGESKMSWRIAVEAIWLVPLLRFTHPPQPPPAVEHVPEREAGEEHQSGVQTLG